LFHTLTFSLSKGKISGGRSVGIVRSRTQTTEVFFFFFKVKFQLPEHFNLRIFRLSNALSVKEILNWNFTALFVQLYRFFGNKMPVVGMLW
jgi:hypothetical protein